ncbi:hypothetical protein ABH991_000703 [Bradyrhizobium ottawaense]|uniref:Uncharacterized protein n=1 Tax=Bradyrhizobium ottawaense TaxID=931866 RepID=A0ABV4FSU2_9BRAD
MCRHASRAGLAVDAAASAREVRAGRVVPVSPRLRADDGAARLRLVCKFPASSTGPGKTAAKWRAVRTAKPCGPGRRCHGQVLRRCERAQPGRLHHPIRGAREARRNGRLPGDHGISRPATAQGRPSVRHHLYAAVRFFLRVHFAQRTAGASRHPVFPAPSWLMRVSDEAKLGRIEPRGREGVSASRAACHKLNLVRAHVFVAYRWRSWARRLSAFAHPTALPLGSALEHPNDVENACATLCSRAPDAAQRSR